MALCSRKVNISRPVMASQIFAVPSRLAEARHRPSGLNATRTTGSSCPITLSARSFPSFADKGVPSQSFTTGSGSEQPQASSWPSGLNATPMGTCSTSKVIASWPVVASQTLRSLSSPAETRRRPSGLKARQVICAVWPRSVRVSFADRFSSTRPITRPRSGGPGLKK